MQYQTIHWHCTAFHSITCSTVHSCLIDWQFQVTLYLTDLRARLHHSLSCWYALLWSPVTIQSSGVDLHHWTAGEIPVESISLIYLCCWIIWNKVFCLTHILILLNVVVWLNWCKRNESRQETSFVNVSQLTWIFQKM